MSMSVATTKEAEVMDMKEQAEKFRRRVLERGEVGPRTRYTEEQRRKAAAHHSGAEALAAGFARV